MLGSQLLRVIPVANHGSASAPSSVAMKASLAFAPTGNTIVTAAPRFQKPDARHARVFRFNQLLSEKALLNAWHNNFVLLQRQLKDLEGFSQFGQDPEERSRVLSAISDKYSADLHAFLLKSNNPRFIKQLAADDESAQELSDTAGIIHDIYCLWRLCHIMFIDQNTIPTAQLSVWLRTFFHEPELLDTSSGDESCVLRALVRGDVDVVNAWLSALAVRDDVVDLIASSPTLNVDETMSLADFTAKFEDWKVLVKKVKASLRADGHSLAARLVDILDGNVAAISDASGVWYERMVGTLLFKLPTATKDMLPSIVAECGPSDGPLDEMLVSIFNMDVNTFLQQSNQSFELSWFQAHLTDLLMHAGKMEVLRDEALGYDLREHYLLEYASTLQSHPQLWHLAASYLVECQEFGSHYLRQLVRSQPITSDQIALKLVALCDRANLAEEKVAIFNHLAMQALRKAGLDRNIVRAASEDDDEEAYRAFLGTAVNWFAKAGNTRRLAHLCNLVLEQYHQRLKVEEHPSMDDLDAIAENVDDIMVCDEVAFLVKFRDLVERIRLLSTASDAADAAQYRAESLEIVVRLLDSNVVPPRFRVPLLAQVSPILDDAATLLSSQDTRKLMESLEDVVQSHLADQYLSLVDAKDVDAIRLTLSDCLNRAIVAEAS